MRRGKMDMQADILKVIREHSWGGGPESSISQLIWSSNITWATLKKLLPELIQSGLITNTRKKSPKVLRNFYSLTPKGRDVLHHYEELSRMLDRP